ncbi:hypothetical protein EVAR_83498_1 [Eumeta japonica]|uniref:Ras-associating domain-containing protein n=1 Tax=Eumeta variegata TaxID=151549 RepID=A0A4C1XYS6_EUMVA|nr:hypothetical protein EVAR_83498_1 [Eumeta japonica]
MMKHRDQERDRARGRVRDRFSLQMRPGGLVKVYDSALMSSSQYKSLLISERTTADELLSILLHCYHSTEGVERFSLYEVSPSQEYERKLHPDDLPLLVQRAWPPDSDSHFRVRRNPRAPPLPPRPITAVAPAPRDSTSSEPDEEVSRALSALSLESDSERRRYSPVYKRSKLRSRSVCETGPGDPFGLGAGRSGDDTRGRRDAIEFASRDNFRSSIVKPKRCYSSMGGPRPWTLRSAETTTF